MRPSLHPARAAFAAVFALSFTVGVAAAPAADADSPAGGSFSVLTYNIAGLPEELSSASTPRAEGTTAIGQRLGPYDIVQVQEDFNYHANLYATDTHPYRTPTSGGVPIGSGLNTLSDFSLSDLDRVKWDNCSSSEGADCLTPKGFTFSRIRLGEGAYVDLYNLHPDAGTTSADLAARASNLSQLGSYISMHSVGNAVVVMGDTNTRYTRTGDTIAAFAAANGLTDAWVELERGGLAPTAGSPALLCDEAAPTDTCEVVDKVLYRSSRLVTLNAANYSNRNADFLDAQGLMLSDHFPIAVDFTWTRNSDYQASDQFGGPHGYSFTDIDTIPAGGAATAVSLRSGSRVDRVGLTLANGTSLAHGGTGGSAQSLALGSGEYMTSVNLCQGQVSDHTRIFYAKFTTSLGRTLAGGTITSDCVTRTAPSGWQIAGFHGRAGEESDKLGVLYTRR
ncbi:Jacalin-like lectin domain-containing protein [Parafrankia irregularis]|uniref:Jacalin-like lectin domain-containing protein n=1 Tax=Parafrankia irregularis TaxID=795642 RepID=A0A0S4QXV1_9ACTN|nr:MULTISPECIES: jacalin-like lectin [Parafrankia]MBE3200318.1 endonuclease/exonuclease/phosphatase family protein [Parafrankia sp. CH37]CUU59724.1 Jacalin-like lectin domain-containing protein [Parafrankia irregularis]